MTTCSSGDLENDSSGTSRPSRRSRGDASEEVPNSPRFALHSKRRWTKLEDTCSESVQADVFRRDDRCCLMCTGDTALKPCRLASRGLGMDFQARWIQGLDISADFNRDLLVNFMSVCIGHRFAFEGCRWTLVPSEDDLLALISFEEAEFTSRQRARIAGDSLPKRSVPTSVQLSGWVEVLFVATGSEGFLGPLAFGLDPPRGIPRRLNSVHESKPRRRFQWRRRPASNVFEFHFGDDRLNAWALIVNCMDALSGGFFPLTERVRVVQANLLKLRDVYNRRSLEHGCKGDQD